MSTKSVLSMFIVLALAVAGLAFIPELVTKAAGNSSQIDSATRSYIAWAKAAELQKLAWPTRPRISIRRGSQVGPTGMDGSLTIDSATLSYMAWAKAIEEQQGLKCPDSECSYRLPNGQPVK